jgi:hypothetical protein
MRSLESSRAAMGRFPTRCGARCSARTCKLTEAAAREGNDRRQRFRWSRSEANEAAAAIEGAFALGLVAELEANAVLVDLDRLAAMLTRLGGFTS